MSAITRPFAPVPAATVNSTVTSTGTVTTISAGGASTQNWAGSLRVYNSGATDVFLEFGGPATTASTATSMPLKAGTTERFSTNKQTHVAAVTLSSSTQIFMTPGEGI